MINRCQTPKEHEDVVKEALSAMPAEEDISVMEARFKAMSSAKPVILLIFTPALGWSSYRVTVGPREMSTTRV